jgi:hypothetical protein
MPESWYILCQRRHNPEHLDLNIHRRENLKKGIKKLSLCFNWAPRHKSVLVEWRYSSTHSSSRH